MREWLSYKSNRSYDKLWRGISISNQTGSAQIIRESLVLAVPGLRLPWGGLLPDQSPAPPGNDHATIKTRDPD